MDEEPKVQFVQQKAVNSVESFVYPEYQPVMQAVRGITYDFNCGARIYVPDNGYKTHMLLYDMDSRNVLFDSLMQPGSCINCSKKFYIRYRIELYDEEKKELLWSHDFSMKDRDVLVQLPYKGAIGDSIAWFSFLDRFQRQHGCRLSVLAPKFITDLFMGQYPNINFRTPEGVVGFKPYATYYIGLFFKGDTDWQPYDFRLVSLAETAGRILGIDDLSEIPPKLKIGDSPIKEPYVCIATQASGHAKHWCNPTGWKMVIEVLKKSGYRVLCMDKEQEVGSGDVWHYMPAGAEDFTGEHPLQERADMIAHAKCFIGLSSGLSWLAWCTGTPVVLISGICMPFGEFQTPYRVQTRHTCHGCWNDTRCEFDHHDFMWCPMHKGDARAYECTKSIKPSMVLDAISRVPGMKLVREGIRHTDGGSV